MTLTDRTVLHYLLERGLLTAESVVDGDLLVVDVSSRHHNFRVAPGVGPGYFVKQARRRDPQSIRFLEREANCYRLAEYDPAFSALAAVVPGYRLYDEGRHILVVELLPEGGSLAEYHRRLEVFPLQVAARLGEAMGAYHQIDVAAVDAAGQAQFPRKIPWILSAHRPSVPSGRSLRGANQQVMGIISQFPEFGEHLDALREQWQSDRFMHGDIKWENCMVYQPNGEPEIRIVDWETADVGDAGWDVGAVFQAYLTFWIMAIPIARDASPDKFLELAPYPIEAMQPAIRAFWDAYRQVVQLTAGEGRRLLVRSAGYAAARMLQTAYEYMYHSPQITTNALALLQVSQNMMVDATGAVGDLLGLEET
jgi:aminoglycoside phosphotransferase (APT) family kinase protein